MVTDMKRYILSAILCLWGSCAWAFPPGFIGAVASSVVAPTGNSDNFSGVDGTILVTHNANWGDLGSASSVTQARIVGGRLTGVNPYSYVAARYTTSTSDISKVTISALTNTSVFQRKKVHVRSSSTVTGYSVYLDAISAGNYTGVTLMKNNTYPFSSCGVFSLSASADHTVQLLAEGTSTVTLTVKVDGSTVCTKTDSTSPLSAGNPGVSIAGVSEAGNNYMNDWSDY